MEATKAEESWRKKDQPQEKKKTEEKEKRATAEATPEKETWRLSGEGTTPARKKGAENREKGEKRRLETGRSRERTNDGESDDRERRGSIESDKGPGKTPVRKSCQAGDSGLSVCRRERTEKGTL